MNLVDIKAKLDERRPGHSLPQALYNDPAMFDFDMTAIYGRSWLMVGFTCELPEAGSWSSLKVGRWPILIVRDKGGAIRAFHNSCRHRGAMLCKEGTGRSPRMVCPYHRWTYNLDGSLLSAARMPADFDNADHGLREVKIEIVAGVIYICLADDAPPFETFRREMEALLAVEQKGSSVWPMAVLIMVVLGGLYSGVATPTEIAAVGALGALLVALATRRMTRPAFMDAVGNTLRITAMIVTIIFGAHLFGYFISFSQVTQAALGWIAESGLSPAAVMLMVVFVYLLLGMVMDQAAIIILTAPITFSLMTSLGYDPIWWGVIIVKTAEIGLVSPPMGLNVFVTSSASRVDLRACFRGVMPFVVTELVVLALLLAFPEITLYFIS